MKNSGFTRATEQLLKMVELYLALWWGGYVRLKDEWMRRNKDWILEADDCRQEPRPQTSIKVAEERLRTVCE